MLKKCRIINLLSFRLTLTKPEEVKPLMGRPAYDKYVSSLATD